MKMTVPEASQPGALWEDGKLCVSLYQDPTSLDWNPATEEQDMAHRVKFMLDEGHGTERDIHKALLHSDGVVWRAIDRLELLRR